VSGLERGAGLTLVLGAGGVRGIAHIGVLQGLAARGIRPDALVGVSSGALVAACHAALGWDAARLADSAHRFGPLAALTLALRRPWLSPLARHLSMLPGGARGTWAVDSILDDLKQSDFDTLHHGVSRLGILCLDRLSGEERFFVSGRAEGRPPLLSAVVGSMSLPWIFPQQDVTVDGRRMLLIDGGVRRTLPIELAAASPFSARAILAIDLGVMTGDRERRLDRAARLRARLEGRLRVARPAVGRFGILRMRRGDPGRLLDAGREAITEEIASWCRSFDGVGEAK